MTSRLARALAAAVVCLALGAAGALADGDPASDVLLGENVFYPYSPPTSTNLQRQLNAETTAAKKAGVPIKVALIGAPVDLGVIPDLYGQPQKYADFLDQEISFRSKQPLLVVMAAGYGTQGLNAAAARAAAAAPKPAGHSSDALATAALATVAKIAAAEGHPVAGAGSSGSGGGSNVVLLAALVVAALATAAAVLALRRRQQAET